MREGAWIRDLNAAITVCDREGRILEMNSKACRVFEKDGGSKLIGTNVLDCHPEPAKEKLKNMMEAQVENIYTTEKNGIKKLVYQTPWFKDGEYMGFIEMLIEIPLEMRHLKDKCIN
jgi:PAS domain S-box-containing protein